MRIGIVEFSHYFLTVEDEHMKKALEFFFSTIFREHHRYAAPQSINQDPKCHLIGYSDLFHWVENGEPIPKYEPVFESGNVNGDGKFAVRFKYFRPLDDVSEKKELFKLSKFLSFVLRHKPEAIDLTLDKQGWGDVDVLIEKAGKHGHQYTAEIIKRIVETDSKKRFSLRNNGKQIRASQGHTIDIDLGYRKVKPLGILFHGTSEGAAMKILNQGIFKGDRHHVHLSQDFSSAFEVGKRHGNPVVLEVNASKMHHDGYAFCCSDNGVWLVDYVPPQYIRITER